MKPVSYVSFALFLLPASVSADGFYLRAFGGASLLQDTDVSVGTVGGSASFDKGTLLGGSIGYDFPDSPWRIELEFAYRGADADAIPAALGATGDFASTTAMVNGVYALGKLGDWQPYVGAGLGTVTEIDFDFDDTDEYTDRGGLAAQVFVGVEYPVTERLTLGGEVRYFNIGSVDLSGPGGDLSASYDTIDLSVGARFSF